MLTSLLLLCAKTPGSVESDTLAGIICELKTRGRLDFRVQPEGEVFLMTSNNSTSHSFPGLCKENFNLQNFQVIEG